MTKNTILKLVVGVGAIGIAYLLIRDLKNAQKNYKASNDANFSNLTDSRRKPCGGRGAGMGWCPIGQHCVNEMGNYSCQPNIRKKL